MKYETALALLFVAVALTAGCLSGVDADEVRTDSLSAMEEVDTYEYDMGMEIEMEAEDSPGSISMSMESNGAVDEAERKMSMFSRTTSLGFSFDQDAYIINDSMYMSMGMGTGGFGSSEELPDWVKIDNDSLVSQTWESSSYAEQYQEILGISDVGYEQDESVDGENAYVLTLDPDIDEYNQLIRDQMADIGGMEGMEGTEGMDEFFSEDSIEVTDVSLRYWISEETGYILRTRSNTTMNMSFELGETDEFGGFGNPPTNMTVTMNADIALSEHGEEVGIELPEQAQDAEPFDSLFGQGGFDRAGPGVDQPA